MARPILIIIVLFTTLQVNAQLSVVKMVGKNTKDYKLGAGLYLKAGYPVSEADDITFEAGLYAFSLYDYDYAFGTIMAPAKIGYRYTLNRNGDGFYVEPQAGYNFFGLTSLDVNGYAKDLRYNGIALGVSTGYLFTSVDLNIHLETIKAKGGSNNYIRAGVVFPFRLKKRESDY